MGDSLDKFVGLTLLAVPVTILSLFSFVYFATIISEFCYRREAHSVADTNGNKILELSERHSMLKDMGMIDTTRVYSKSELERIQPSTRAYYNYIEKHLKEEEKNVIDQFYRISGL